MSSAARFLSRHKSRNKSTKAGQRKNSFRPICEPLEDKCSPTDILGVITNDLLTGDIFVVDPDPFAETATKSTAGEFPSDADDGSTLVTGVLPSTNDESHTPATTSFAVLNTTLPDQPDTGTTSSGYDILISATAFANPLPNPLPSPLDVSEQQSEPPLGGGLSNGLSSGDTGGGGGAAGGFSHGDPGANAGGDGGGGGGGSDAGNAKGDAPSFDAPSVDSSVQNSAGATLDTTSSGTSAEPTANEVSGSQSSGGTPGPMSLVKNFAKVPMPLEVNRGQTDSRVQFLTRGAGYTLFLTPDQAVFSLVRPDEVPALLDTGDSGLHTHLGDVLAMNFLGANVTAKVQGLEELTSRSNYFLGESALPLPDGGDLTEPSLSSPAVSTSQIIDVPHFSRVQVTDLYPGVDVVYYSTGEGKLEFDVIIQPGADYRAVQWEYEGSLSPQVDSAGNLVLNTAGGQVIQQAPKVYQVVDGSRQYVQGQYELVDGGWIQFQVAAYDVTRPLMIDPVLDYSTYLGGSGADEGLAVAVDGSGQVYVTGKTASLDFPLRNPFQATIQGTTDVFVSKLNPTGDALVYSTYLGGSGEEQGNGIAVDWAGYAYVVGTTNSTNFPATTGAYQTTNQGGTEAFVAKLSTTGDTLVYASYLGGAGADAGPAIAVDTSGQAHVTGQAGVVAGGQTPFPTSAGAFQSAFGGGTTDAFVTTLNATGSGLVYSSFLGGGSDDVGNAIAIDSAGLSHVTGRTSSGAPTPFPTTAGAYQTTLQGGTDAFVSKVNSNGTALVYSSYLGGSTDDTGYGVIVDGTGAAYVTGSTAGSFPTTAGAMQTTFGGGTDAFVSKLNPGGTAATYATYLGGAGNDTGRAIARDDKNQATLTGQTFSTNFPTYNPLQSTNQGSDDAFVSRLNAGGTGLVFSTYLGGSGADQGNGLAVDLSGSAYVAGTTGSSNFPTVHPFQGGNAGSTDAFVAKILDGIAAPTITSINTDTGSSGSDLITSDSTLILSGTASAGSQVTLHRAGVGEIDSVTADATTGAWSFDYTATTLPSGTHAFTATATLGSQTSAHSPEYQVAVDSTAPTVDLYAPATTSSLRPEIRVWARDLYGLPNGTAATLEIDRNNDGIFESSLTGSLMWGMAVFLPTITNFGTHRFRAKVTDLAGNQGTSPVRTMIVSETGEIPSEEHISLFPTRFVLDGMSLERLGNASVSHALDLDQTPCGCGYQAGHQAGSPTLIFNSVNTSVRPIFQHTLTLENNTSFPASISVELIWNEVSQGVTSVSTADAVPGDAVTVAAQVNSPVTETGPYRWELNITIPDGSETRTIHHVGGTFVVAHDQSPYGPGWRLSTVDRLIWIPFESHPTVPIPAGYLRVEGTGGWSFYNYNETTQTYGSPAGDAGTLANDPATGGLVYTLANGVKTYFNAAGYQTKMVSADGTETILLASADDQLSSITAIDGTVSTFAYAGGFLSSITTAGPRTYSLSNSSGGLTQITDPDGRSHAFTYDGNRHVTRETRGELENQWRYASAGGVDRFTWGTASHYDIKAVGLQGLVSVGATRTTVTDALGMVTRYQFNGWNEAVEQVHADGSIWNRAYDVNGRIVSASDPLGRAYSFTYDVSGYPTGMTYPNGTSVSWAYLGANHALTSFVNQRGHSYSFTNDSFGRPVQATNALGEVTTLTWNQSTGLLASMTDPMNRTTSYQYDGGRRLTQITDVLGTTQISYDANGNVATTTDRKLRVWSNTHDALGRLLSSTDPAGNLASWVYTSAGLLQSSTDRNGTVFQNQYDGLGRGLLEVSTEAAFSPVARTNVWRYDVLGRVDGQRLANGGWYTATLDALGAPVRSLDPLGGLSRAGYDLGGLLTDSQDPLGFWSKYTLDSVGQVTQWQDPRGFVHNFVYEANGLLGTVTDPLGHSLTTARDALGRVESVTDAALNSSSYSYWGDGSLKTYTDARGTVTHTQDDFTTRKTTITEAQGTPRQRVKEQSWDGMQNVTSFKDALNHVWTDELDVNLDWVKKITDPNGNNQQWTYDKEGQVIESIDGLAKKTTLTRDALGRVTQVTDPNGNSTKTMYDSMNQVVSSIDGLGQVTKYVYDLLGRNTFVISPRGARVEMVYDGGGRRRMLIDPVGNVTRWVHNANDQVTKEIDPLGKSRLYVYDGAGRLTSTTDRLGRVREFVYFNNNLLQTENWRNTAAGPIVWTRSYTYNANDQLLTATDNNGTYTFTIDELNRVTTQNDIWNITLTNTWDAGDRLTQVTDTKGGTLTYEYDNGNRNTVRKFAATGQEARLDLVYNARNQVTEVKRYTDNAAATLVGSTVYAFDDGGRNTSITHKNGAGATLDSFNYIFDAANRVTQETSTLGPTRNYSYDLDGELLGDGTQNWSYDLNGNRTAYTTTTGNRLSSDGTWNYTHDDEGNLTQKEKVATSERWNYFYNHLNQMTKAEHKSSSSGPVDLRVEFKYDVLGNRVEKSVDADGDGSGTATITRFAYDPFGNAWADLDATGALTTRRLYFDAVDAVFASIGASNNENWYLTDRLGSVRDLANSTGALIDHIDYTSFGAVLTETQPTNGDRYKFTSRELDSETGLQYNRARYYQFDIGRWTSEDPIGFGGGDTNLYRYVGNAPTNATDPSGLQQSTLTPSQQALARHIAGQRGLGLRPEPQPTNPLRELFGSFADTILAVDTFMERLVRGLIQTSDVAMGGGPPPRHDGDWEALTAQSRAALDLAMFGLRPRPVPLGPVARTRPVAPAAANCPPAALPRIPGPAGGGGVVGRPPFVGPPAPPIQTTLTQSSLIGAAQRANAAVGPGSGPVHGTAVHRAFQAEVNALRNNNLGTEVSYLNGRVVSYGTPGSIRVDVVEGPLNAPTAIYDLKTGGATLSALRIREIRQHVPGGATVPIIEIR